MNNNILNNSTLFTHLQGNISSLHKKEKRNLFNIKIIDFLEYLDSIININIDNHITNIKTVIKYNKNVIFNLFNTNIKYYEKAILEKDSNILYYIESNLLQNKIEICKIYNSIDNSEKENVWKYLKLFLLLTI